MKVSAEGIFKIRNYRPKGSNNALSGAALAHTKVTSVVANAVPKNTNRNLVPDFKEARK